MTFVFKLKVNFAIALRKRFAARMVNDKPEVQPTAASS